MKKRLSPDAGAGTSREEPVALQDIPNIGPAIAEDLRRLGIQRPVDLKELDPYKMYDDLCRLDGKRYDPCVMDVFIAAVDYMNGGPSTPWWKFTPQRKLQMSNRA